MLRTIPCYLPKDDMLLDTIKIYNQVVQEIIDAGWQLRTYSKKKLHKLTYKDIRKNYPKLQSSLVQSARDMACGILKREKFKNKKPVKKELSAICFNQRTFTPFLASKILSISTISGRSRYNMNIPAYFQQYLKNDKEKNIRVASLTLKIKKEKIVAYLTIELPDESILPPSSFLGVDRGIHYAAVCSTNKFYPTKPIRNVKWHYQQLRQKLQAKGTRSAKRKLKKLSGRERRFMTCENRKIAKWLVDQPKNVIVLEHIRGLKQHSKKKKKIAKKIRRKFGNWAYYQLEQFIIERAEKIGKTVLFVSPAYTSQRCWNCGSISKAHRRSQGQFLCRDCGFELNADLNAARNLSDFGKAVIGRASVNRPNVAETPMTLTIQSLGRRPNSSYKPLTSVGGS